MTTFDPEMITFFAKTDARGQEVAFGIKAKDRQRHMYVVGKTGMGKSTLLENMAAQDIQNGEGMAFIDPHGSAAETLLEYVPEHRVKDVVYFAPFDLDHPVSFNVMEDVGPDKRHLVVSGLMSTFKKIWVDAWSARMEYILTNALLALIEYPDTTLLSVNRLFVDKDYRKKVVEYIKDPAVKAFWTDEFANYTDRFTAEALPAIQNKIGQFTGNPLIRNIIGQPHSSFDIRKIMDEKKILIMNLSKGLIGETNANLLGSMLTTRIYLAAMSRADLPVAEMRQMPNFYFYVDEFQSFANATFANILSEARKYHLNLIIAHQYIEQMEEDVRNAVFGNVGTTIAFRVGPFDAEVLETVFAPRFEATDLVNLGFAQIYLTLMIDGIGSQPFSAITLPPVEMPSVSCRGMVIESSRKLYAKERVSVEKIVADLHTPQPQPREEKPRKPFDRRQNNSNNQSNQATSPNQASPSVSTVKASFPAYNSVPVQAPAYEKVNTQSPQEQSRQNQLSQQNERKKDFENKKPVGGQKTPEDLRQILSKMTQGESTEKKNNSVSVSTKVSENNQPSQPTPQKESSERSDLKSALADVLQKAGITNQTAQPQAEESADKQLVSKPLTRQPIIIPSRHSQNPSNIRKVVVEHRQRRSIQNTQPISKPESQPQLQSMLRELEAESEIIEKKNPLDATEIKRMLKQSDNERSPFN